MQTQMTKAQLIEKIAQLRELAKKDVKAMMEALTEVAQRTQEEWRLRRAGIREVHRRQEACH